MKTLPFSFIHRWADIGPLMQEAIKNDDEGLWREVFGVLEDRDRQLEDHLSRTVVVFDRDASTTRLRSKPWTAKDFGQIREWNVELGMTDAGVNQPQAGAVTLRLDINGVVSRTLVLPAGAVYLDYKGELPTLKPRDRLTLYCAQLGFDLVSTVSL